MSAQDNSKLPADIRKCCLALGLSQEKIDITTVQQAWEQQTRLARLDASILGQNECDQEVLVFLNKAKQTLTDWIARAD